MMQEHFRLVYLDHAPPEKWLALGRYCLVKSGLAPEVSELLKASGPLYHRQVKPADLAGTEPDPFSDPEVETAWHALQRFGPTVWHLLQSTPFAGEHGPRLRVVLLRAMEVLKFLTGGYPWTTTVPGWLTPFVRTPLFDVFGQTALRPLFAATTDVMAPIIRPLVATARAQAEAHLAPVLTDAAATIAGQASARAQRELLSGGQHLLGQPHPAAERLAQEEAAQTRWLQSWYRTTRTELADAHAIGTVGALVHETGPATAQVILAYRVPSVRACLACRALYLESDGAPKLYPLGELIANGTNHGRRQEEWRAVVNATHPNCVCAPPQRYLPLLDAPGSVFDRMRAAHVAAQRAEEEAV